jgi:predicted TIM-barrel fold metal-dependent hydrolase
MDFEYEDQYKDLPLKLKPSEYWRRQCKATFQYDRVGTKLIDEMGVETLMWGSDYPLRMACGRSRRSTSASSSSTCRRT